MVTARTVAIFRYACPYCTAELTEQDEALFCTREGRRFVQEAGIWRLLRRERAAAPVGSRQSAVGSPETPSSLPTAYCLLPTASWPGFGATLRALDRVLDREFRDRPVRALDLSAGNCWLTPRLAGRGYAVCALDLRADGPDGLAAGQRYRDQLGSRFERVQAEMECLPFVERQFELVIASHTIPFAENFDRALDEARRVLAPNGILILMGIPFSDGGAFGMRHAEQGQTVRYSGFRIPHSTASAFDPVLTYAELPQRLGRHSLEGEVCRPFPGVRYGARRWLARLRRVPEPPSYPLVVCRPASREV